MILSLLLAAAAQAGAPAPAAERLTPEQSDARCVVVLGFISRQPSQTPQQQEAIRTGTAYYMGKMRGRNPRISLAPALNAAGQLAQAQKVNVAAEAQRCGKELTDLAAQARTQPPTAAPKSR